MTKAKFNNCINRIRHGERRELKRIYDEYYAKITYTAVLIVKDYHTAQDIASEVMLYILQNAADIGTVEYPDAWMQAITKNRAIDFVRKDSRIIYTDDESLLSGSYGFPTEAYYEMVEDIRELTQEEQDLIEMHYVYGYNYKEISEMTDTPVGTIKSRIYKIKKKIAHLKKYL